MLKKSFTYGQATITLRPETGMDVLALDYLRPTLDAALPPANTRLDEYARNVFCMFVQQSQVEGDLGFAFPSPDANGAALAEAYQALTCGEHGQLMRSWKAALNEVNLPPSKDDAKLPDGGKAVEADPKNESAGGDGSGNLTTNSSD